MTHFILLDARFHDHLISLGRADLTEETLQLEDVGSEFPAVVSLAAKGQPSLFKAATLLVPIYLPYWDYEFTVEDLQAMATNFDAKDPPPILLNHDWDADKIQGHVRAMRYDESTQRLRVLLEFLGESACTYVTDKRWRKLSGGFRIPRDPEDGAPIHSKASVLEASVTPFPMVGEAKMDMTEVNMEDKKPAGEEKGKPTAAESQTPAAGASDVSAQAKDTKITAGDISSHPDFLALQAKAAKAEAKVDANEVRLQALEAQYAQQQADIRKKADEDFIEALIGAGFSTPALKDDEIKVLASLNGAARDSYIALRKQLPAKAWPDGGRQSDTTLSHPGQDVQAQQEARLVALAAKIGTNGEVNK